MGEICCSMCSCPKLVKPGNGVQQQNPMYDGDLRLRLDGTHEHLLRTHLELNSRPVESQPDSSTVSPSSPNSIQLLQKRVFISATLVLKPRHQPIR